jgi:hypothetical protein
VCQQIPWLLSLQQAQRALAGAGLVVSYLSSPLQQQSSSSSSSSMRGVGVGKAAAKLVQGRPSTKFLLAAVVVKLAQADPLVFLTLCMSQDLHLHAVHLAW